MLVVFGSRMDPSQVQIRAVTTKDAKGTVTEMPPPVIQMMQATYRSAVAMLIINWQGLPQEPATVPAGRFDGCFKTRTDAQWGPWRSVADSWSHPVVPLSGAVRSQGVDQPVHDGAGRVRHQRRRQRDVIALSAWASTTPWTKRSFSVAAGARTNG